MIWKINLSKRAEKQLGKIDKTIAKQIVKELREISNLDNPRIRGKALTGNYSGFWRYRVRDYRIICAIENNVLTVFVVDIDHHSRIYSK
ncbi:type II toxin-antitoxin system RelE family toxin [Gardnerella vaginalis]|uniref:type II toxin-antitoxin system RelE family toxin n=1 Tax=Gardnerella TaxID=2701 RepID=UPI000352EC24|nr:type II toxin-antitoxin system RelE/ParE family toxin [Gardnerella vaginalis]EPI43133.1 addiction module toxin, RelE/StbE family [Gardnerella vaginalis JCP8481A]EPI43605.1 addiction module toxin, RelE/StbE family [Gardnerella vaginalis JCP8481B]